MYCSIPKANKVKGSLCRGVISTNEVVDQPSNDTIARLTDAPVAQLDRVSASEAEGRGFESRRARHFCELEGNLRYGF